MIRITYLQGEDKPPTVIPPADGTEPPTVNPPEDGTEQGGLEN
jgi:hypothetical protein